MVSQGTQNGLANFWDEELGTCRDKLRILGLALPPWTTSMDSPFTTGIPHVGPHHSRHSERYLTDSEYYLNLNQGSGLVDGDGFRLVHHDN